MTARTTTALSLTALLLAGCGDEAPAPDGALDAIERQAAQETASQQAPATSDDGTAATPEPEDTTDDLVLPDTSDVVAQGERIAIGNVSITLPESWTKETPSSAMRAAQYSLGEGGEFVVFTGIGGGVEPNINRWIGQIGNPVAPPSRDVINAGGVTVHTVSLVGTYAGMAGPPQDNTAFYGAIIEGASTEIQIRLTVPADRAESAGEWDALIASIVRN